MLVGALALGGIAFYLSNSAISAKLRQLEEEARRGRVMQQVVVASRDLRVGDVIDANVVALRGIPQEYINDSTLTGSNFEAFAGQSLLVAVKKGEPISSSYTATRGGTYFSGILKDGRRALTMEVDEISSISGMLRAGDRIDILLTAKPTTEGLPTGVAEDVTFPMLSNVEVLATGQAQRGSGNSVQNFNTVTLDVSPTEATDIVAAKAGGKVTAILRSPSDQLNNASPSSTLASVIAGLSGGNDVQYVEYIVGGRGSPDGRAAVSKSSVLTTEGQQPLNPLDGLAVGQPYAVPSANANVASAQ